MTKKIAVVLAGVLVFSLSYAWAEDKTEGAAAKELSAGTPSGMVTAIEVKGNKTVSSNTVISKMKTKVGSPYLENVISDDLKRLYLLGFFSDIKIDTESYKGGVKVIVNVTERPVIEKITFSGIKKITLTDEKLKGMLKSRESQYLDYPSLSEDTQTLKGLYDKIGYSQAQVDYKVTLNKENGKARVDFTVTENKKVTIKNIIVQGNKSFSSNRILRLMKTKRGWLFNAGVLKEEVLVEDIERIKSFYQREGFTDVAVDYEVKPDPKKPYFLYIYLSITEGKRYLVGDVTISGYKDLSEKEIISRLKDCSTGKVFSNEAMKKDIANIQSLYFDRGYIMVQVENTTSLNPSTGRIDIAYSITENQVAYVGKVKVRGNVKTKDIVVRRELRIKPGDRFDGEKLRRSKERLQNLGFFEDVSYDTEDTKEGNKKDLVVEVKEAKTGAFSFGGGYSSVDKLVGFIEIEQNNFDWRNFPYFTGAGQNLKLRASIGNITKGFDLSFTEPWLFDYPIAAGFDAYQRQHQRETNVGYGYDEKTIGGDFRLGKEISEYVRGDITYRCDNIRISNISDNATEDLRKEQGTNIISSLQSSLTFDSRDSIFDTHRGNIAAGSFEVAGGPFSGDKNYVKFYSRLSHFFPLLRQSTLEVRGRFGLAKAYGKTDDLPIYERFFAGGSTTIRGYNERKVGPIDRASSDPLGGDSMIIGNIEYVYPLLSFLKLAAFYDVGNVWNKPSKIGTGSFKSGLGVGVRLKTPIGPIMLDYGIPLNKEPGEDKVGGGKVHFSVSQGF